MALYAETLTLAEARERYFTENGFNPAYDDRWVKLRLGSRSFPLFPNTRARVAAARIHDLHHVTAGYDTTWTGEGEIGAWELASGCGRYLAAWVLNLSAFAVGCCISPRRMLRAFVRGRRTKNLYGEGYDAARLTQRVGDVRRELGLDQAVPSASAMEVLAFVGWLLLGALYAFGGMLSLAVLVFSLWKMPSEGKALSAPHAQGGTAAPAQ
jgi:hypothetical protein